VNELEAIVADLPKQKYTCGHCQVREATCYGKYDNMTQPEFACDECCGHGCEDGQCVNIRVTQP
jgi:hypothetical protein